MGGKYATAETCDAAKHPIKDTAYVQAVHDGCETKQGRGTYGYAYDDGVGLKQCSPVTKYEWVLCPDSVEGPIAWQAVQVVKTARGVSALPINATSQFGFSKLGPQSRCYP